MTALDIITQARERLGDINKKRWTDNRLLSIVSQGQQDLCKWTNFLRKVTYIPLANGITVYQLPNDCYRVSRVEYNGLLIQLFTRDDLDIPRIPKSDLIAIKSNLNMDKIEILPELQNIDSNILFLQGELSDTPYLSGVYGVVTNIDSPYFELPEENVGELSDMDRSFDITNVSTKYGEVFDSSAYPLLDVFEPNIGCITQVDSNLGNIYGFVTSVGPNHIVSNRYGLITSISELQNTVKVYYVALPPKLKYLEAVLVIPELWEDLLIRYVVGTALQDDNDSSNIQRGEMELQKYQQQVMKLRSESAKDFSGGAKDKLVTNYRRI